MYICFIRSSIYTVVLVLKQLASCGEAEGPCLPLGFEFNFDVLAPSHRRLIDASMSAFGSVRVHPRVLDSLFQRCSYLISRCRWVDGKESGQKGKEPFAICSSRVCFKPGISKKGMRMAWRYSRGATSQHCSIAFGTLGFRCWATIF